MSCHSKMSEYAAAVEAIANGLRTAQEDTLDEAAIWGWFRDLEAEARALAARMRGHVAPPSGPGDGFVPTMTRLPVSPETKAIIDRLYPATTERRR